MTLGEGASEAGHVSVMTPPAEVRTLAVRLVPAARASDSRHRLGSKYLRHVATRATSPGRSRGGLDCLFTRRVRRRSGLQVADARKPGTLPL